MWMLIFMGLMAGAKSYQKVQVGLVAESSSLILEDGNIGRSTERGNTGSFKVGRIIEMPLQMRISKVRTREIIAPTYLSLPWA